MKNLLSLAIILVFSFSFTTAQTSSEIQTVKTLAFVGVDTLDLTSVPSHCVKLVREYNSTNTIKVERKSSVNAASHITKALHKAGFFSLETETYGNKLAVKPIQKFVRVGNADIQTDDIYIIYVNPTTPIKLRS